ncbi:hypothetical protein BC829DRAFT_472491 [Chytridium lagenaria]|nr:hypothetical protein BC829DRAFT_472491 [Chytridium lagenaria]
MFRYQWDESKRAWFPMWDEDLIKSQQSAYGGAEGEDQLTQAGIRKNKRKVYTMDDEEPKKKPKQPSEPKKKANTSVYVTGLPVDVTAEEIKESFESMGLSWRTLPRGSRKLSFTTTRRGNSREMLSLTSRRNRWTSLLIFLMIVRFDTETLRIFGYQRQNLKKSRLSQLMNEGLS